VAINLALALTFFNFVGANAARMLLTLFALELGAPAYAVGLIGGLLYLFPLLLSWPIGMLVDRRGSRGLLTFAAVCGGASLVLPYLVPTLVALYVAAALNGLALAFYHVTLQNLIGTLSKPEDRPRHFSNFSLAGSLTNFFGPLGAGFAIDYAGHAVACLMIASQSVVALALLLVWGGLFPRGKGPAPSGPGAFSALKDPKIVRMLATSGIVQLGQDLFQFYLPIYSHTAGLSASVIGGIMATLAVASFAVRMFLARLVKRFAAEKLLAWALFTGAIGFALVPFTGNAVLLGAIAFLFGLGMGLGVPLTVILMYSHTTEGRTGQTLGLRLTTNNFVRVTGPIVFGAVGTALGLPPVFWINAAAMVCGALLALTGTDRPEPKAKGERGK
jgi:predicted MFS family arabinose efflux permease